MKRADKILELFQPNAFMASSLVIVIAAAMGCIPVSAFAQSHQEHSHHMDSSGADPASSMESTMPGMDHNAMPGMDHGAMSGMDHGRGPVPPETRDPDAYSDGYTRDTHKYPSSSASHLHMSDEHSFASVQVDRFEYVRVHGKERAAYEGQAWFGGTYNRAVLKTEGEAAGGKLKEAQTELLWGHAFSAWWDTLLGLRVDHGQGPRREWLAMGVQGLSPYWFDIDATAYIGSHGRTALNVSMEYDLLFTQRLVLQPRIEVNFYGKDDRERDVGGGLSDGTAGLRLKYEVTRRFIPYIGVEWSGKFGKTADFAYEEGERKHETRFVAGISFQF